MQFTFLTCKHLQHDEPPTRSIVLGVAVPPCPPHTVAHHHTHIVHTWSHLLWETPYPDKWVSVFSGVCPIRLIARGIDEVTWLFSNEYCFNVSGICRQTPASESKQVANRYGWRIEVVDLKRQRNTSKALVGSKRPAFD